MRPLRLDDTDGIGLERRIGWILLVGVGQM